MSDTTIIDAVAAKAAPLVGAQAARWTDILIDAVSRDLLPRLPSSTQGLAAAALDSLKQHEGVLGDTTARGFFAIVHHLALGDEDRARQAWLASSATHRARMDALDAAFAASEAERKAHAETWALVKDAAVSFLRAAGSVAFPILISAIAI